MLPFLEAEARHSQRDNVEGTPTIVPHLRFQKINGVQAAKGFIAISVAPCIPFSQFCFLSLTASLITLSQLHLQVHQPIHRCFLHYHYYWVLLGSDLKFLFGY